MSWAASSRMANPIETRSRFLAGETLPDGLLPDVIGRSWQRCVDRRVNVGRQAREIPVVSPGALGGFRERSRRLILHAEPVMEQLYEQISGTSSVVVLTDATGVVLHSVGDPDFVDKAQRVTLQAGGIWTEEASGTNAIGTALVEQAPVSVHSAEHFIDINHFLTCSAAPIFDPQGKMLGVLDVSSDSASYQLHTMALVRMSAQMIENQFFAHECTDQILIHFHLRPEFIGTLYEAIAVFSLDGRFVAANRSALVQLGLNRYDAEKRTISSIFDLSLAGLFEQARSLPQPVIRLRLQNGMEVFARVKFGTRASPVIHPPIREPNAAARVSAPEPAIASMAALDLGDPAVGAAIRKAGKIIGHDIPLMIEGESGSGKEMFARAFHADGPREKGPFVALNCAAIPEGLIESELFGYREGAFTGARRSGSVGKIQQADGGTLFLDEIGDMPLTLQARLLRVLQDRTVTPLGGTKSQPVDIKIVCATNRRLRDEVAAGRFREDLYYRLNGLLLSLPPLRSRTDRIGLAVSILATLSPGDERISLSSEVLDLFYRHAWPGNIRQMTNVIRTALALRDGENEIRVEHLPEDFLEQAGERTEASPPPAGREWDDISGRLEDVEAAAIREALRECNGNVSAAARKLGVSRSTLYRKAKGTPLPLT
ncbi:sigma-54-dependent Fis family transcriptional regulator [Geobacter pickeringii]|uniref:Fis family transcriptional regulator n=1 Tax=Geobacter pickeringii TaxID=345632 RepID=A0A0B5BDB3_9BACT|nr:sigma-54-dependent Fis family transcriptional regulator [Geobacter pickeringii]AJE03104.1 Fis family transcriptional regulator [Geobacter pickeringii]